MTTSNGRAPGEDISGGAGRPRLLPGENPDTDLLDDVTHWIRVYSELLDSGWGLLDGGLEPSPGVDGELVQAHLRRLESRLEFWLDKRAQLTH